MENTIKIPQMLTIRETAELFNLPIHFVRQKVGSGEVVSVRAGRKFLVNAESVSKFLRTDEPQGAAVVSHESCRRSTETETVPRIVPISLR